MPTAAEEIALELLTSDGIAAIWKLHLIAATAHRARDDRAGEILIAVADAAEEVWRRRVAWFGETRLAE
jgi:hypothetical protein